MNHREIRRYYPQERNYTQRWGSGQMQEYPPRRYDSEPKEYIPPQYEPRIQKRPRDPDYRPASVNPQQSRMQNDYRMQSNRYNDDQRYNYKRYDEDKRPPSRFDRYENRYEEPNPQMYQNSNIREQSREEKELADTNEAITFIKYQQKVNPAIELFPTPVHHLQFWD